MNEATIQKILEVKPIENSDNLDVIKVLGWSVVVRRNEYKVDDLCVYITIDSIVPDKPEFEFLRRDKFIIKSRRLRGQLSQGIVFPLSILENNKEKYVGMDVSDELGVTHYEKPIPVSLRGLVRGNFPSYIRKTDEPRIQNCVNVLNEIKDNLVYATVKCDGTSLTCSIKDGNFHICSRNNSLKLEGNETNSYVATVMKYKLKSKLTAYGKNIALQGELCGPGIQKNRLGLKELKIFMFNLWLIDEQRYGNLDELAKVCADLELDMVPVINVWNFTNETVVDLLEMSKGIYDGTNNMREGIVIRPIHEMYSNVLKGRLSFKIVNDEYLLKYNE